ncbi:MAG TPA: right-handed parallel beta-helix repeat-containing protein [Terriglobia bacterium]|nr:right-handed parallel beta-helix repeat-containing protein [Terriglobia bacterium]
MTQQLTRILLASCLLASAGLAASNAGQGLSSAYFVATDGNDGFSGTLSAPNPAHTDGPFRTLERAQQAVEAVIGHVEGPITVEIRGGTYYLTAPLTFTRSDSGSEAQPITWEGFPGDPEPLISGGQRLTGWTSAGGGLWTLRLPASFQNFEALYVNGVRRYRPGTSSSYLHLNPVVLSAPAANCTERYGNGYRCGDRFSFVRGDLRSTYSNIHDVEIVNFEDWTVSRMRLQSVDTSRNIAYITGMMQTGEYFGFLSGHRYLVQNSKESFSRPGQWYLNRGTTPWTLAYRAATPGENPNSAIVIAPQQPQILVAHELQYVTFRNLAFSHDNYVVPTQGHPGSSGETTTPAALSFNESSDVTLSGVTIAHTQGWGVEFIRTAVAGRGNTVSESRLYDLGAGGVRLGLMPGSRETEDNVAQSNTLSNNVIYGGGRFLPGGEGTGIWIGSSHNNVISHNDIHDFYNGAVELGQTPGGTTTLTHDNVIEYNLLHDLGQGVTSDMGCVHAASSNNTGNLITNNVCHDVTNDPAGYGGNGIYLDTHSENITVQNNLVYRVSDSALFVNSYALDNTIDNNIFAYARRGMIHRGPNSPGGNFTATHNIFLYDIAPIQRTPGDWVCEGNCTGAFDLDSNVYWNTTGRSAAFITTVEGTRDLTAGQYSLSQWASDFGEDVHSVNQDPGLTSAAYPKDEYALGAGSPAFAKGFHAFSAADAGPQPAPRTLTAVPAAFPLQTLNPATDF